MQLSKFFKLAAPVMMVALSACGSSGYAGYYGFTMGKEGKTRIGITMTLSDKEYVPFNANSSSSSTSKSYEPVSGKQFTMEVINEQEEIKKSSSSSSSMPVSSIESSEESSQSITSDLPEVSDQISSNFTLSGAYKITDEQLSTGRVMELMPTKIIGIEISEEIQELLRQGIKYALMATIANDTITVTIPVSLNDLAKQLDWYITKKHSIHDPLPQPGEEGHWWTVSVGLSKR